MSTPDLELHLVGFSHRTAPVAVRERFAVRGNDLAGCHASIATIEGVREAFVLSTCNRTEALVAAPRGADPTRELVSRLFRNIDPEHLYVHSGVDAVIHLFRVAAGLDSMVLGESEVLSQVKRSHDTARSSGVLGKTLGPLVHHAIALGKRVRKETAIGEGTLSVARVGVDVAARVFGSFERCRATVLGAGETGVLVARYLKEGGIRELTFLNRTEQRAHEVAQQFGARSAGLDDLAAQLARTDVVICAIDGEGHVVDRDVLSTRDIDRRDRPYLVIDLSVPRAVDPRVADIANVLLYDLDDLGRVVQTNLSQRKDALEDSNRMLVAELHKFFSLRTYQTFTPAIAALHERFERVRDEVLDQIAGDTATPEQLRLAHELAKRLLDVSLGQMKESARYTQSESVLESEYRRYLENL